MPKFNAWVVHNIAIAQRGNLFSTRETIMDGRYTEILVLSLVSIICAGIAEWSTCTD